MWCDSRFPAMLSQFQALLSIRSTGATMIPLCGYVFLLPTALSRGVSTRCDPRAASLGAREMLEEKPRPFRKARQCRHQNVKAWRQDSELRIASQQFFVGTFAHPFLIRVNVQRRIFAAQLFQKCHLRLVLRR